MSPLPDLVPFGEFDAFDWSVNQLKAFQCTALRFRPFDRVTSESKSRHPD
jgi:hypothetical protein